MAVDPLHRIGGHERKHPGQHLVQRDAQRVKVASGIDRPVHSPGLFRRHVGECAGNHFRRLRGLTLARQAGSDAKSRQPDFAGRGFDEDVGRLNVLMNKTCRVELPESVRQGDGHPQKLQYFHWSRDDAVERLAAGIVQQQDGAPVTTFEGDRLHRPIGIELFPDRVLVLQLLKAPNRRMFRDRLHDQEARPVALPSPPTQDELAVLPERLEDVCRKLNHGRRGASAIGILFSFPENSEQELIFGSATLF